MFAIDGTLYDVAIESDRRIKSGKISPSAARGGLVGWAVAKLAVSSAFAGQQWQALSQVTHGYNSIEFRKFFRTVLEPSAGGNVAWRASENEQAKIIARIDALATELINLIIASEDLDVSIKDVAAMDDRIKPLSDYSRKLEKDASRELHKNALQRNRDSSLTGDQRMEAYAREALNSYRAPRLLDYLDALQSRIAGTLPRDGEFAEVFADLNPDDRNVLAARFGLDGGFQVKKVQTRPPRLRTGGNFGAYPKQRKALRTATIHAIGKEVLSPWGEPPSFSVGRFIEALCISWFGDSPERKEIDALIRGRRAEQQENTIERAEWESAYDNAIPHDGDEIETSI